MRTDKKSWTWVLMLNFFDIKISTKLNHVYTVVIWIPWNRVSISLDRYWWVLNRHYNGDKGMLHQYILSPTCVTNIDVKYNFWNLSETNETRFLSINYGINQSNLSEQAKNSPVLIRPIQRLILNGNPLRISFWILN